MTFKELGDVYSGEFEDSMFHGGGKFTYANGDEYSGEFENGKKNGSGVFTFASKGETTNAPVEEEAKSSA